MIMHSTHIRRSNRRGLRLPLPTARAPPGSRTLQSTWSSEVSHEPMLLSLCDGALFLTHHSSLPPGKSLTDIHGLSSANKVNHAAKVATARDCTAAATEKIFKAAGGNMNMYKNQKDRLAHLFTLLQASDLS